MCTAEAYGRGKAISGTQGPVGVRFLGNAMSGIADRFAGGALSAGQTQAPERRAQTRMASRSGSVLSSGGGGRNTILGG